MKSEGTAATQLRGEEGLYPDFSAEMADLARQGGADAALVRRILDKHRENSAYNLALYRRYEGVEVPIYGRGPRFAEDDACVNNKINNDFFGEIADFFTGYFAGKPIGYSYNATAESEDATGGAEAVQKASKALSDFVTRNNMMDVDMEVTKFASVCGYAARLFYIDAAGAERVMPVAPFEAAILAEGDITEPMAAVRYFETLGPDGEKTLCAEFYDGREVTFFSGEDAEHLAETSRRSHPFGRCPLQGIPKNGEMMGDAEKVLLAIDAYDRAVSDANNEIESFANAYMVFENVNLSKEDIARGQRSGAFQFYQGGAGEGKIYFLTKDPGDAFMEHHLDRLEKNIYRFARTPNLNDAGFSQNASGVALKFKLTGLETKCGVFEAKMLSAGRHMFSLLAAAWAKRDIAADPLQCSMDFHRNFPLDVQSEAEAVKTLVEAGLPGRVAYGQLSFVDDVDWLLAEKDAEAGRGCGGALQR